MKKVKKILWKCVLLILKCIFVPVGLVVTIAAAIAAMCLPFIAVFGLAVAIDSSLDFKPHDLDSLFTPFAASFLLSMPLMWVIWIILIALSCAFIWVGMGIMTMPYFLQEIVDTPKGKRWEFFKWECAHFFS